MENDSKPHPLDPKALSLADAAKLLSKAGGMQIGEAMLQSDANSGAPLNADGTINLVNYGAWLTKEAGCGD